MKDHFRLAAFRAPAPDTGAGEGGAAPDQDIPGRPIADLADAAYEAATGGAAPTDVPDGEPREGFGPGGDDEPEEDAVADADESEGDAVDPDAEPDAYPPDVLERYPALAPLLQIETALADPARAPETLREFVEAVAAHHGLDPARMLGFAAAAPRDDRGRFAPRDDGGDFAGRDPGGQGERGGDALVGALGWREAGFDSQEAYDAAPEYQRMGYDSPGELRLARRLEALQAQVAPTLEAQRRAEEGARERARTARYEEAVARATPTAIARVRAETGWSPTEAQVMAAAKRYPQVAAGSLSEAVQAAHVREIAAHAAERARAGRPKPLEMPQGGHQPGRRALGEADRTNVRKLADHAYEVATS